MAKQKLKASDLLRQAQKEVDEGKIVQIKSFLYQKQIDGKCGLCADGIIERAEHEVEALTNRSYPSTDTREKYNLDKTIPFPEDMVNEYGTEDRAYIVIYCMNDSGKGRTFGQIADHIAKYGL